jgi:hypothetical protein
MEQSGRNGWQPVANATAPEAAQIGENRCRGLRPVAVRSAWEGGVDGDDANDRRLLFIPPEIPHENQPENRRK